MGHQKRELERLEDLEQFAIQIAKDAVAVKSCEWPGHDECYTNQYDDDANKRAYAIGTNRWKAGGVPGTREEFMDAIKQAIDDAPDTCPECERMLARND